MSRINEDSWPSSTVGGACGLYAIVDPELSQLPPLEQASALLRGGCALLQLRAKRMDDGALLLLARAMAERCREVGVPFVLNDRPDLALLAGADGLHLGQGDLPVAEARRIVGAMPIGLSTHNTEQLEEALRGATGEGADLLALGPIYPTRSKENPDPVVGLVGLREAASRLDRPLVAIGGVSLEHASEVAAAGASLVAAISALCAPDPSEVEARARAYHRAVREAAAPATAPAGSAGTASVGSGEARS